MMSSRMDAKTVYFVFVHPHRTRSRVNATVLETIRGLSGVTVCDLYETYPDFNIDVEREKNELLKHSVIFLQHPFYWYNMPPLLKLWFDEVFEIGFAYGPNGTALKGKTLQLSISAGGPDSAYDPKGYNRYKITDFLTPYDQTAHLCGMHWAEPLILYRSIRANTAEIEAHAEKVRDRVLSYTNPLYRGPQP